MITISSTAKKEPIPPLIKINEVARMLSASRHMIHSLIDNGDLKAADVNPSKIARRHRRVTRRSLLTFYKKRFGHSLNHALLNPFEPNAS